MDGNNNGNCARWQEIKAADSLKRLDSTVDTHTPKWMQIKVICIGSDEQLLVPFSASESFRVRFAYTRHTRRTIHPLMIRVDIRYEHRSMLMPNPQWPMPIFISDLLEWLRINRYIHSSASNVVGLFWILDRAQRLNHASINEHFSHSFCRSFNTSCHLSLMKFVLMIFRERKTKCCAHVRNEKIFVFC